MTLLRAADVHVRYRVGAREVHAVRGVSLSVARGERVGLIGESGSGKSSLARALLGLEPAASGEVTFDGQPMAGAPRSLRRRFQPVFQDVGSALDPRQRLRETLAEPLVVHGLPVSDAALAALLEQVQLGPELLERYPRALSVGQRQRVNLARALALDPELLLLDEPVSALDVSVQAQVLNLLNGLVARRGLALLVISHDLDVVAHLCQRVLVLFAGRIVEAGPTAALLATPRHPYTRALVAARGGAGQAAEAPAVDTGCAYRLRCPDAVTACAERAPELEGDARPVACFVPGAE